jgi:hypothetical protein
MNNAAMKKNESRHLPGFEYLVDAVRAEPMDEFPMDRSAVDYSFGDIEIEDGHGGKVAVRDLSEHLKNEEFETPDELLLGMREALASWKGLDIPLRELKRPEDLIK